MKVWALTDWLQSNRCSVYVTIFLCSCPQYALLESLVGSLLDPLPVKKQKQPKKKKTVL